MKRAHLIGLMIVVTMMLGVAAGNVWAQDKEDAVKIEFDPSQYTCKQFTDLLLAEEAAEETGFGLLWINGYVAGAIGYEKSGPLTEESFGSLVAFLVYFSEDRGDVSLLDALDAYVKMNR